MIILKNFFYFCKDKMMLNKMSIKIFFQKFNTTDNYLKNRQ